MLLSAKNTQATRLIGRVTRTRKRAKRAIRGQGFPDYRQGAKIAAATLRKSRTFTKQLADFSDIARPM
jgi:hypothetical protein